MVSTLYETPDVVVLGMGPGGEEAAGLLADAGLDVVGVDERLLGGECPYYGCIPSKIMVRSGDLVAEVRRAPGTVGTVRLHPEWRLVARRVRQATDGWDDKVAVDRFAARGGRFVRGTGRLTAPGEVTVLDADTEEELVLRPRTAIVLATGSEPVVPPVPGLAATPFWTNREAVETEELPESLLVLGGGAVGLELGQAWARLGCAVTVLEAASRLTVREEPECSDLLLRVLSEEGVSVHTGTELVGVEYRNGRFLAQCRRGERVGAERMLVATGRRVDLDRLGVAVLGVPPGARVLPVDERLRVAGSPHVFAVGDVTGRGAYTHLAVHQARIAARAILGRGGPPASYHAVPRVTFTDPEIGAVGLTEAEARAESGAAVRSATVDLAATGRALTYGPGAQGFVKLVADGDRLVGATVAAPNGSEVLGLLTLAVQARLPLGELGQTVWAFPTFHRAVGEALSHLG